MRHKPTWDLRTIPDELLYSEAARRRGRLGGRPKSLQPCPKCGAMLGAREMRAHKCGAKQKGGE